MRFAGESACATTGKSFACKGGAGAFACQLRLRAIISQLLTVAALTGAATERERSCNRTEPRCHRSGCRARKPEKRTVGNSDRERSRPVCHRDWGRHIAAERGSARTHFPL